MIERLQGQIVDRSPQHMVIMVGGVGLHVSITKAVYDNASGSQISLLTHLIVREDALTLYGFANPQERDVFETIIKISGVGPRLAIAILNTLSVDQLRNAVTRETPEILTRVPGIGKKTAQKMILELKDKVGWQLGLEAAPELADVDADVLATLTALGYSIVEAQTAIQSIPRDTPNDVEERVRIALEYFI